MLDVCSSSRGNARGSPREQKFPREIEARDSRSRVRASIHAKAGTAVGAGGCDGLAPLTIDRGWTGEGQGRPYRNDYLYGIGEFQLGARGVTRRGTSPARSIRRPILSGKGMIMVGLIRGVNYPPLVSLLHPHRYYEGSVALNFTTK